MQELLVRQQDNFLSQEAWETSLGTLFPNGLMLMDGDRHLRHRTLMRQAFTREALDGYLPMMLPALEAQVAAWGGGGQIRAYPVIKHLTLRIAMEVFFGLPAGPEVDRLNAAFAALVRAATALPIRLPFTAYGKGLAGRRYLEDFFARLIPQRRAGNSAG